jgi:signal transduction histidine kinase
MVVAGTMRILSTNQFELADVFIDWALLGFTVSVGLVVHRRTAHAEALTTRLQLADVEHEVSTREAVSRERAIIARELHDIVAHSVSLMVVQAGSARPIAQRVDGELADVLETIEHAGRQALTELRRLLHLLRSEDEDNLQPVPDLSHLDPLFDSVRKAGVDVRATIAVPSDIPPGVALCAYRTVQEGLTNAMRYAEGSRVDVDIAADRRTLVVRVVDAGGHEAAGQVGTGTGLVGLRERVLLCGGRMVSGPDASGYRLEVRLPLSDQALLFEAPLPTVRKRP